MKRKGILTDRSKLVKAIERMTGLKAVYSGAPFFKYTIGSCTVNRDSSIECDDEELLRKLEQQGVIEAVVALQLGMSFPMDGFTGRTLVNIVNMLSSRGALINKAIDHPNAFYMRVGLVRDLKKENPATVQEFMDIVYRNGGERAMKGIRLCGNTISFPGFPDTETNRLLADCIVKSALSSVWIKSTMKDPVNEKYALRSWLNSIGMKGTVYKKAREELMKNLDGDSTYRTPEQRAAFMEKRRAKRSEPEFVLL